MSEPIYEPDYMCWHEQDFWGDRYVISMTKLQRHFYRALLQAAFFCSTRPHLPDDDEELSLLADADDVEVWKRNRQAVLRKFEPFTDDDGRELLRHRRLERDWEQLIAGVEQKRRGGKARHARAKQTSAGAEQVLPSASQTETENRNLKPERKTEKEIETETEITVGSVSGSAPSHTDGVGNRGESGSVLSSAQQKEQASLLVDVWANAMDDFGEVETSPFIQLLSQGIPAQEIKQVLLWLDRSNYWGKPGKGQLEGPEGFRKAYSAIRRSYQNYKSKISEKKRTQQTKEDDNSQNATSFVTAVATLEEDEEDFG
jgi:hypothetical protein